MAFFPVTYIEVILWLILLLVQSDKFETLFLIRIFGVVFGFVAGADCLAGERWLFVSSTGVFTMVQFDDGLTPLLSVVMIFGSAIMFMFSTFAFNTYRKNRKSGIENVT